ncbi:MAG TPA: sodium:calcium antiporter, partial [Spirochaetota bacterium]|nr:sodium:calcium antiporter [Spirochaetota bacterium]
MIFFSATVPNVIINAIILIAAILCLWKGADYLVDSASRIAEKLGISDLVIGLTVVAFGTSAPEFAVTINAALRKQADISVGNIVGSNIFNLGFILGSVAMVRSIQTTKKLVYRDGVFMFLITLVLLFFFRDYHLAAYEGGILMSLLALYMLILFIRKEPLEEQEIPHEKATLKDYFILPLSVGAVVAGGHFLVESATFIARTAGISEWVIGVTIVAAGTSAPEMATSLAAVIKGKHGMSAGNLIGSDLFNILGVLGLAGAINPMAINKSAMGSLIMLSGMVMVVLLFLRTGW